MVVKPVLLHALLSVDCGKDDIPLALLHNEVGQLPSLAVLVPTRLFTYLYSVRLAQHHADDAVRELQVLLLVSNYLPHLCFL